MRTCFPSPSMPAREILWMRKNAFSDGSISDLFAESGVVLYGRSVARRAPREKFRNIE